MSLAVGLGGPAWLDPRTPLVEGGLMSPVPALFKRIFQHLVTGVHTCHAEALFHQHDGVHPGWDRGGEAERGDQGAWEGEEDPWTPFLCFLSLGPPH